MSKIRLIKGYSDEFLLQNRPRPTKKRNIVKDKSKVKTGILNAYQVTNLSESQRIRLKDYYDRKGART